MVCRAEPETSGCVGITDHTLMLMKAGAIKAGSALTLRLNEWLMKTRTGHGLQSHAGPIAGCFPRAMWIITLEQGDGKAKIKY